MQVRKRVLSLLLSALMVVTAAVPGGLGTLQVQAAEGDVVSVEFLATSDLHGQLWTTDYTADYRKMGTYKRGFIRLASYIKERRAANPNVFLGKLGIVDNNLN